MRIPPRLPVLFVLLVRGDGLLKSSPSHSPHICNPIRWNYFYRFYSWEEQWNLFKFFSTCRVSLNDVQLQWRHSAQSKFSWNLGIAAHIEIVPWFVVMLRLLSCDCNGRPESAMLSMKGTDFSRWWNWCNTCSPHIHFAQQITSFRGPIHDFYSLDWIASGEKNRKSNLVSFVSLVVSARAEHNGLTVRSCCAIVIEWNLTNGHAITYICSSINGYSVYPILHSMKNGKVLRTQLPLS